jgi:Uma2 family endonuclease
MHAGVSELGFTTTVSDEVDQRVILTGVAWTQYEALLNLFGDDQPGVRVAYLGGDLEIMSPSRKHERIKKVVARLLELYALEKAIALTGLGSTTFREAAKERGAEPDECYCVGEEKDLPDIAFEVVLTSGGINKLAIYEGLGVPEVWFWRDGVLHVYGLTPAGYERKDASTFLPGLHVARLASFVELPDQDQAIRSFRASLRGEAGGAFPSGRSEAC